MWLLDTPKFRRVAFDSRGTTWQIPQKTTDPHRALENLLARDALFTEDLRKEATALRLKVIDVDVGMTVDESVTLVRNALDLV